MASPSEPGGGASADASPASAEHAAVLPSPLAGEGSGEGGPADTPEHAVDPDNLAYVIYTSGSTGAPKGVLATHRGLSSYLDWFDREVLGAEGFALPLVSRLTFDAHVRQLFPPLLRGEPVWVLPEETATDPAALLDAISARGRVSFGGVPSLWSAVLERVSSGEAPAPPGLQAVLLGGEALPAGLADRTFAAFPGVALWNHYGPTEATVNTTAARVEPGRALGIGRPVADARVYLLDAYGGLVPVGVPGELHVGGAGVARGYLGRPELTAEKFVPDPFRGEPGARMYRSGDRVRRRADGELEWMGRTDQQLKVRGFRIEPGEVEAALAAHPRVREAAVAARPDAAGEARLVGYVVPEGGAAPPAAELRAWLAGRLPGHMVPDAVVELEKLPSTPSGKVDRRALPAPVGPAAGSYVAPRTPTEEILAGIWAEMLERERVGAEDDFFALGGHSLLATRVVTRVRQATGADLSLRAMFEARTPAALAERVDALLRAGAGLVPPPIRHAPRDGPLPLSFAQQRLWFIQRMEPASAAYNLPFPLRLRGALDPRTLRRALTEIVRRHEALRTVFRDTGGDPEQVVLPPAPFPVPAVDLSGLAEPDREREAVRVAAREMLRPFDLERGPLLRVQVVRVDDAEWLLLGNIHHAVSDGWSTGVLVREVSTLYGAFSRGAPSPLPELPLQYADYAVWQRGWLRGATLERQVDFWRERLRGAPPLLELPLDRPRPALPDLAGGDFPFALPPAELDALRGLARREGATVFVVLLAALQALLARSGAGDDVPVGTSAAGRTRLELEPLIGFFVNTLVLRGDLSGAPTGRELLRRVRETLLEAHAHQDLPFERVVAGLRPERSLAYNPLFQVFLAMVNVDSGELRLGDVEMTGVRTDAYVAQFELALVVSDQRGRVYSTFSYRKELFDESTVERLSARLRRLVAGMAADPGARVDGIDLLAPEERRAVLAASRGADAGPAPERTLHALFAGAAERTPDAPAVEVEGGGSLTYAELHARSDRLAGFLASRGAGPEAAVGVCMRWSPAMVAAVLGILEAGAVYLPLDPGDPPERLAYVMGDAGARLLLADASTEGRIPDGPWETVVLDDDGSTEYEASSLSHSPFPENAAYVIYTSGSTGAPKGVVVEHRAAAAHSLAFAELAGLGAGDRVLQFASAAFDVSLEQLFPTLLAGAALVLRGPEQWSPESFGERARALGITVANLPVAYWQAAAEDTEGGKDAPAPRLVVVGGEAVPSAAVRRWRERFPAPHRLLNGYGPTEAVVTATVHELPEHFPGDWPWPAAPIGGPLPGRAAYVLDDAGEPAADGIPGELYLGGPTLARGYLGRPELTAERWLPDPFSGVAGARLYRSGDRARRGPGGALEFLGRTDRQLKVRGFRIEPGEVEAALLRHPAVREAAVVAAGEGAAARLVAYLVPAAGRDAPAAAELREGLRGVLPEHLVPAAFVALERLPLTPGGKLDRRSLPAPEAGIAAAEYVPPRTPDEERLAAIFAEVLGVERVGAGDHFFDLGGHSLLATRVVARVHREMGVEVPVRVLFEAPTVAALAAWLQDARPAPELEEWEVDEEWERLAGLSDDEVQRMLGGG
ncbi:MAG: amino acid adenylation domain-containing protein [Longimicrobiaceae bacterium]